MFATGHIIFSPTLSHYISICKPNLINKMINTKHGVQMVLRYINMIFEPIFYLIDVLRRTPEYLRYATDAGIMQG